jgi:hypothetical protein
MTTIVRPSFPSSGRQTKEATMMPIMNGLSAIDAARAVSPRPVWKNSEMT